eukprot:scaffold61125_cov41-Tisochrysis_lutea.AAC.1
MGATIGVTYPLLMVPLLGLKVRGDSCQSEYLAWIAYVLLRLGVAFPRAYSYCEHPLGCEEDVKDLWDRLSITFFDLQPSGGVGPLRAALVESSTNRGHALGGQDRRILEESRVRSRRIGIART